MYSLFGDSQEYDLFRSDISDIDNVSDSGMDSDEEYHETMDELLKYAEKLYPSNRRFRRRPWIRRWAAADVAFRPSF